MKDIKGQQLNQHPVQPKLTKNYKIHDILVSLLKKDGVAEPEKDRKYLLGQD